MTRKLLLGSMMLAATVFGQAPAAGGRGPGRAAPQPPVLVLKETWKDGPGNVPLTQDFVLNPDLKLEMYTTTKEDFGVTSEGGVPHIWTGLCASSCALTLASKTNYLDLTGKARVRWFLKTSGFHEVRPVVKLADGTFLLGDHTDSVVTDYKQFEFFLSDVHWLKVEMPKVLGKNTVLEKVDLSKVDAIGFADLTPGSGHGLGGFSDMGWIEVYGKAVPREAK